MNIVIRPLGRTWSVQTSTGYSTTDHASGSWVRGTILRSAQPALKLPEYHYMFDPGDPLSIQARTDNEKRNAPVTIRSG